MQQRPKLPAYLSDSNQRDEFKDHITPRLVGYESLADIVVDTEKYSLDSIIEKIIVLIREREGANYVVK